MSNLNIDFKITYNDLISTNNCKKIAKKHYCHYSFSNKLLFEKHNLSLIYHYIKTINPIIEDKPNKYNYAYKDLLLYDDIEEEYQKRYYNYNEFNKKIILINEYYKYHFPKPVFFTKNFNELMEIYHTKKIKLYYKQLYIENNFDSKFKNSSFDSSIKSDKKTNSLGYKSIASLKNILNISSEEDKNRINKSKLFKYYCQKTKKLRKITSITTSLTEDQINNNNNSTLADIKSKLNLILLKKAKKNNTNKILPNNNIKRMANKKSSHTLGIDNKNLNFLKKKKKEIITQNNSKSKKLCFLNKKKSISKLNNKLQPRKKKSKLKSDCNYNNININILIDKFKKKSFDLTNLIKNKTKIKSDLNDIFRNSYNNMNNKSKHNIIIKSKGKSNDNSKKRISKVNTLSNLIINNNIITNLRNKRDSKSLKKSLFSSKKSNKTNFDNIFKASKKMSTIDHIIGNGITKTKQVPSLTKKNKVKYSTIKSQKILKSNTKNENNPKIVNKLFIKKYSNQINNILASNKGKLFIKGFK